jgi:hypothetical protein
MKRKNLPWLGLICYYASDGPVIACGMERYLSDQIGQMSSDKRRRIANTINESLAKACDQIFLTPRRLPPNGRTSHSFRKLRPFETFYSSFEPSCQRESHHVNYIEMGQHIHRNT